MHADIATRRRLLLLTYQRYLAADRAWDIALRDEDLVSGSQPAWLIDNRKSWLAHSTTL